jgi:hypothetical protein
VLEASAFANLVPIWHVLLARSVATSARLLTLGDPRYARYVTALGNLRYALRQGDDRHPLRIRTLRIRKRRKLSDAGGGVTDVAAYAPPMKPIVRATADAPIKCPVHDQSPLSGICAFPGRSDF